MDITTNIIGKPETKDKQEEETKEKILSIINKHKQAGENIGKPAIDYVKSTNDVLFLLSNFIFDLVYEDINNINEDNREKIKNKIIKNDTFEKYVEQFSDDCLNLLFLRNNNLIKVDENDNSAKEVITSNAFYFYEQIKVAFEQSIEAILDVLEQDGNITFDFNFALNHVFNFKHISQKQDYDLFKENSKKTIYPAFFYEKIESSTKDFFNLIYQANPSVAEDLHHYCFSKNIDIVNQIIGGRASSAYNYSQADDPVFASLVDKYGINIVFPDMEKEGKPINVIAYTDFNGIYINWRNYLRYGNYSKQLEDRFEEYPLSILYNNNGFNLIRNIVAHEIMHILFINEDLKFIYLNYISKNLLNSGTIKDYDEMYKKLNSIVKKNNVTYNDIVNLLMINSFHETSNSLFDATINSIIVDDINNPNRNNRFMKKENPVLLDMYVSGIYGSQDQIQDFNFSQRFRNYITHITPYIEALNDDNFKKIISDKVDELIRKGIEELNIRYQKYQAEGNTKKAQKALELLNNMQSNPRDTRNFLNYTILDNYVKKINDYSIYVALSYSSCFKRKNIEKNYNIKPLHLITKICEETDFNFTDKEDNADEGQKQRKRKRDNFGENINIDLNDENKNKDDDNNKNLNTSEEQENKDNQKQGSSRSNQKTEENKKMQNPFDNNSNSNSDSNKQENNQSKGDKQSDQQNSNLSDNCNNSSNSSSSSNNDSNDGNSDNNSNNNSNSNSNSNSDSNNSSNTSTKETDQPDQQNNNSSNGNNSNNTKEANQSESEQQDNNSSNSNNTQDENASQSGEQSENRNRDNQNNKNENLISSKEMKRMIDEAIKRGEKARQKQERENKDTTDNEEHSKKVKEDIGEALEDAVKSGEYKNPANSVDEIKDKPTGDPEERTKEIAANIEHVTSKSRQYTNPEKQAGFGHVINATVQKFSDLLKPRKSLGELIQKLVSRSDAFLNKHGKIFNKQNYDPFIKNITKSMSKNNKGINVPQKNKPIPQTIFVQLDVSGSMGTDEIYIALTEMSDLLNEKKRGLNTSMILFFADTEGINYNIFHTKKELLSYLKTKGVPEGGGTNMYNSLKLFSKEKPELLKDVNIYFLFSDFGLLSDDFEQLNNYDNYRKIFPLFKKYKSESDKKNSIVMCSTNPHFTSKDLQSYFPNYTNVNLTDKKKQHARELGIG